MTTSANPAVKAPVACADSTAKRPVTNAAAPPATHAITTAERAIRVAAAAAPATYADTTAKRAITVTSAAPATCADTAVKSPVTATAPVRCADTTVERPVSNAAIAAVTAQDVA